MTTAPTAQALAERLARMVGPEHVLLDPFVARCGAPVPFDGARRPG